jgi:hypothetical protein
MLKLTTHADPEGYSEGTWEYRIEDPDGNVWFDGGYPSEEQARKRGEQRRSRLVREGY